MIRASDIARLSLLALLLAAPASANPQSGSQQPAAVDTSPVVPPVKRVAPSMPVLTASGVTDTKASDASVKKKKPR